MPELPEIETVRRAASPLLEGKTVESVDILAPKIAAADLSETVGRRITTLSRRGKALVIGLDDGSRLIIRFGMTGTLLVLPDSEPVHKHARVEFGLNGGYRAEYRDMRMFGHIWHIRSGEEDSVSGIENLGIEPDDPRLDGAFLRERFGRRSIPIKSALLTQDAVCGLGNIYSDEVLWRSKICPLTPCSDMCQEDWGTIAGNIRDVISDAVDGNTVSMEEFAADGGMSYRFNDFNAYGREGEPCRRCGTPMTRSVVGGRSTVWCPSCQSRAPGTISYK